MKKLHDFYQYRLQEFLTHTLKPYEVLNHIENTVYALNDNQLSPGTFDYQWEGRYLILTFEHHYASEQILTLLTAILATGYYVAQYKLLSSMERIIKSEELFLKALKTKNIKSFQLKCEPKWDNTLKNIPDPIYHITLHKNTNNILKYGLLPSSGKKKGYHPERNYFCLTRDDVSLLLKDMMFMNQINKHHRSSEIFSYDLLAINTKDLKSIGFNNTSYEIVFYQDENSVGIYTYDLIPPEKITVVQNNLT